MSQQMHAPRRSWIVGAVAGLHARKPLRERDVADRPLLDTVRWISAAVVVLGHSMGLVFARNSISAGLLDPLDFLSGLRGPAVTMFFVISGYLVGGGVLERARGFRWKPYAVARFSRIYIVLIPAILLICLLDGIAFRIDPASPVYNAIWPSGVLGSVPIVDHYAPINWVVTILSLAGVVAAPLGTGNALWSLGYEWVFYFVFPLLVVPFARFRSLLVPLVPITLLLGVLIVAGRPIDAAFFAIWIAGAYARVLNDYADVPGWLAWAGALVAAAALVVSHFGAVNAAMLVMGLGFSLYLSRRPAGERGLSRRVDRLLADSSYSLYVTHFPVVIFLAFLFHRAGLLPVSGLPLNGLSLAMVAAMMIASLALAWAFGVLFEQRTGRFRAWIDRRLA